MSTNPFGGDASPASAAAPDASACASSNPFDQAGEEQPVAAPPPAAAAAAAAAAGDAPQPAPPAPPGAESEISVDPPAFGTCLGDGGCGFSADLAPFTMHLVIFDIIGCHRQECTCANMKRDCQNACAGGGNGFGQIIGEMQSGCWRRHSPAMARKHGLVIFPVGWLSAIWAAI